MYQLRTCLRFANCSTYLIRVIRPYKPCVEIEACVCVWGRVYSTALVWVLTITYVRMCECVCLVFGLNLKEARLSDD